MQRECNDVAFGELTLSTRLKRNKKKIHPSLKSWYRRSVQLLNMSCKWLLHKRVLPSQTSTWANTSSLHKPVHQLLKHEPCFGDLNLTITWDVSNQPNGEENERSLLQDGKQEDVWWWRRINNHWSWHGAKWLRKGPRRQRSHQQRWWGSHTSWQNQKRKWWLIWQLGCRHARHWWTEGMQLGLDW